MDMDGLWIRAMDMPLPFIKEQQLEVTTIKAY
jgi:hypothetical protein